MKQRIKQWFFSPGRKLRRLRGGVAKGMLMELDLSHQSQYYWGLYERELFPVLRRLIPSCKSLVDVGANDGYYTMAFLKSSAEQVVACEPGPAMRQLLVNANANGYQPNGRFSVEQRLVGHEEGMVSITDLVRDLPRPVLLKVDIDGGEADLLESAEGCECFQDLRWVIETHSKELEDQCIKWLHSHNYKTRIISKAFWRHLIPEHRPLAHNRWQVAEPDSPRDPQTTPGSTIS
jgi:hypothetical protein